MLRTTIHIVKLKKCKFIDENNTGSRDKLGARGSVVGWGTTQKPDGSGFDS
jgi:hypothetical protein